MGTVGALAFFCWFNWRLSHRTVDNSPYTGLPLRRGADLGFYQAEQVYKYLFDLKQYDNRMFDLKKAAFCRDTGRIFPDAINWLDCIRVDWNFLQKRFKGHFVSWGSLTFAQQEAIRAMHDSLEGFETIFSSSQPQPKMVEPEFAFRKPGPLYVDVNTNVLVGWKEVPGTELEVLIVQRPVKTIMLH